MGAVRVPAAPTGKPVPGSRHPSVGMVEAGLRLAGPSTSPSTRFSRLPRAWRPWATAAEGTAPLALADVRARLATPGSGLALRTEPQHQGQCELGQRPLALPCSDYLWFSSPWLLAAPPPQWHLLLLSFFPQSRSRCDLGSGRQSPGRAAGPQRRQGLLGFLLRPFSLTLAIIIF